MAQDFYVNLSSDGCHDIFPSNLPSDFRIQLPSPIVLETPSKHGRWTCGLSSIQFGHEWNTITEKSCKLWISRPIPSFTPLRRRYRPITDEEEEEETDSEELFFVYENEKIYTVDSRLPIINLPQAHYESAESVIHSINQKIKEHWGDLCSLELTVTGHTKLTIRNPDTSLVVHSELAGLLGWTNSSGNWTVLKTEQSTYVADIHRYSPHHLFLYTPIVEHSIVGNIQAPILRVFSAFGQNTHNNVIFKSFSPILYSPVQQTYIDIIRILIRDSTGKKPVFRDTPLMVTLHFHYEE